MAPVSFANADIIAKIDVSVPGNLDVMVPEKSCIFFV
jgi:hypothetical protein